MALYVLGACGIGTMVAVFNGLGFRLSSAPYDLPVGTISLVYLVYALGSVSSAAYLCGWLGQPGQNGGGSSGVWLPGLSAGGDGGAGSCSPSVHDLG